MAMYKKKAGSVKVGNIKSKPSIKGGKGGGAGLLKSPITGVVCGIVILACLFNLLSPSEIVYKKDFICNSCHVFNRLANKNGACPACDKENTLYPALKCNSCSKNVAVLPPLKTFICTACQHTEEAHLKTSTANTCPKCNKKTFLERFECSECNHLFGNILDFSEEEQEEGSVFIQCPKCEVESSFPLDEEYEYLCNYCGSPNLVRITPIEVIKGELGRSLSKSEREVIKKWEAKQ